MRWFFITPFLTAAVLVSAFVAFNMGFFHTPIEKYLSQKMHAQLNLGPTKMALSWPPTLSVGATTVDQSALTLSWKLMILRLERLAPPYSVSVVLDSPKLIVKGDFETVPAEGAQASGPSSATKPIGLALTIRGGEYQGPQGHVRDLDLSFEQRQLMISEAKVHLKALVESKELPFSLPIAIDSDAMTLSSEQVKASDLRVSVAGLHATAQGESLLKVGSHRWKAVVSAPDLSKLPKPPIDIAAKAWRGAIDLKVDVTKAATDKPWSIEGDIQAHNVGAELAVKHDKLSVRGPFALNLSAHFQYANERPMIRAFEAQLDLSGSEVVYEALLHKRMGQSLQVKISAQGDEALLHLNAFEMKFWNAVLKLKGDSELKAPFKGKMQFEIPAFQLLGAEQIFLPLARSPVQGEVELRGEIEGPLTDPMHARIGIQAAQFKKVAAEFEYSKPGAVQIRGPVKLDANVVGEWDRGALKQVQAKGDINLTAAAMVLGPLRKEARQNFVVTFNARNAADVLQIGNFELNSFFGVIKAQGRVKNLLDPTLEDFQLSVAPLGLSELRIALPEYHDLLPKGAIRGEFRLAGKRDATKPWSDWPLQVDGNVRVQIPEYKMDSAPAVGAAPPPSKGAATPEISKSFLPEGALTRRLQLKLVADVNLLKKDTLNFKGLHAEGTIDKGQFRGEVSIQDIFSGAIRLTELKVPLLAQRATIEGSVAWQNLIIQDAIAFAKPEYKEFADGRMAGHTAFSTYMPSDKDFLSFLKAKGDFVLLPVTLKTVKIGEMINEMVQKLPELIRKQAGLHEVKVEPMNGSVKGDFNIQGQAVQLENFVAQDVSGSELHLRGKVVIPVLQGDLAGHFLWAKPQVQGCLLEGNSDAQGRMLIPVAIKGDLMHPGFSMLSDLLSKLGSKALQCEQKKLTKDLEGKVKAEASKKLEQEGKKLLKGLFGK